MEDGRRRFTEAFPDGGRPVSSRRRSFGAIATVPELVLDASAVVRGLTGAGEAAELFDEVSEGDTAAHAPDVIVAEVANAMVFAVRIAGSPLADAEKWFGDFLDSPLQLHPVEPIAAAAFDVALDAGLSAYDAFYAVLAATLEIPLATADRKLAAAVPGAVLVA